MAGTMAQPLDANGQPIRNVGYDYTNHQLVIPQTGAGTTDPTGLYTYGPLQYQQLAPAAVNGTLQNAQAGNAVGTPLSLLGNASVILTVAMTGFTGVVNFEVSEDNSNYDPIQTQQEGTDLITTSVTGATTTSTHLYEASTAGLQSIRARTSGVTAGSVTVTAHSIPVSDAGRTVNAVITPGQKATYAASVTALASAAAATDIFTITGSATKTIKITRLELSGVATTILQTDVLLIKRSTANSAGTVATLVPYDSTSPAATAAVQSYTANPGTLGTAVGTIRSEKVLFNLAAPTAVSASDKLFLDFGSRPSQAVVLRGVAQSLSINLNAATIAGPSIDITIEWTEE